MVVNAKACVCGLMVNSSGETVTSMCDHNTYEWKLAIRFNFRGKLDVGVFRIKVLLEKLNLVLVFEQ